jgi:hypothetical protein
LSKAAVIDWAEAAAVCLNECGHTSGVKMAVVGVQNTTEVLLDVPKVDESMLRTHQDNLKPAVEMGAVAVVASVIQDLTDDLVLKRGPDHTGYDYLLARRDAPLFQNTTRIEISGILRESANNTVEYRIRKKRERLGKYPDERPAKIAVVEFAAPRVVVEEYG